ncbi:MAG: cupin domain-containing protein [Pseudomonadaceae bacterium]|nr:cupin domain-containing protein [Pseudomonadaceae bacterium]
MEKDPGPHELAAAPLIMTPEGSGIVKPLSENFYAELDRDFHSFKQHVLVMTFSFDEAWPTWEIHPHGDEFVYLLEGDTDFILRTADGDKTVRVNEPGSYVLVPRNTWHTARPHAPTRMLFVTPGESTLNQVEPGGPD